MPLHGGNLRASQPSATASARRVGYPTPNTAEAPPSASNSARPWLAPRQDTPVCNYTRRAQRSADPGVWSKERQEKALKDLERDYLASSAAGPAQSVIKTWQLMHEHMHGLDVPAFPLTVDKITRVAAAFKAQGYRSYANYLSKAKEIHVATFGDWTADLQLAARRTTRSVTRGIGPASGPP